jgi:hypothetical protein
MPAQAIRSWSPLRPLLINASKSRRYPGDDYADLPSAEQLAFGVLFGVVEVVGCVPLAEVEGNQFAVGRWY